MSSAMEVYNAYYEAARSNPPSSRMEAIEDFFSEDFKSMDKDGSVVMDRMAYVGMVRLLFAAINDLDYVLSEVREEGESVIVSGHFEGTHTGDLDLSAAGMGFYPASGRKIVWPETSNEFMIESDKIVSIKPYGDSGGTEAFFAAFGVKAPTA